MTHDVELKRDETERIKKHNETERIKKFVRDYAEMFGLSKIEAFREIVQRKFNPPDDMRYWIQLTIDKEWLA